MKTDIPDVTRSVTLPAEHWNALDELIERYPDLRSVDQSFWMLLHTWMHLAPEVEAARIQETRERVLTNMFREIRAREAIEAVEEE